MTPLITRLILAGLFTHFAGIPVQTNYLKASEWLIGTWENKTPKGSVYETWNKDGNRFLGKSYMVKESDTVVFENLQLVGEAGRLYYIPIVKNQNGGQPVRFAALSVSDKFLVFENQEHDFPQRITYHKITQDSLVAEISGRINGAERKQIFPMRRVPH